MQSLPADGLSITGKMHLCLTKQQVGDLKASCFTTSAHLHDEYRPVTISFTLKPHEIKKHIFQVLIHVPIIHVSHVTCQIHVKK